MKKISMIKLIPWILVKTSDNLRHRNHVDTIKVHLIRPDSDLTWCSGGGYTWANTIQAEQQEWIRLKSRTVKDTRAALMGSGCCSGCKRAYIDLANAIATCQKAGIDVTMPTETALQGQLI